MISRLIHEHCIYSYNLLKYALIMIIICSYDCNIYMAISIRSTNMAQWLEHSPPLMWTEFDSRDRRHMWALFVVGSRPCSERFNFSPGTPVFPSP